MSTPFRLVQQMLVSPTTPPTLEEAGVGVAEFWEALLPYLRSGEPAAARSALIYASRQPVHLVLELQERLAGGRGDLVAEVVEGIRLSPAFPLLYGERSRVDDTPAGRTARQILDDPRQVPGVPPVAVGAILDALEHELADARPQLVERVALWGTLLPDRERAQVRRWLAGRQGAERVLAGTEVGAALAAEGAVQTTTTDETLVGIRNALGLALMRLEGPVEPGVEAASVGRRLGIWSLLEHAEPLLARVWDRLAFVAGPDVELHEGRRRPWGRMRELGGSRLIATVGDGGRVLLTADGALRLASAERGRAAGARLAAALGVGEREGRVTVRVEGAFQEGRLRDGRTEITESDLRRVVGALVAAIEQLRIERRAPARLQRGISLAR